MQSFFRFVIVSLAALAPALPAQDWAGLKAPQAAEPGARALGVSVDYGSFQRWALPGGNAALLDVDGLVKQQQRIEVGLELDWQWNDRWGCRLALPYRFAEFSRLPPEGFVYNFRLDDPNLRRAENTGDLSLDLRRAWGPWLGAALEITAPTGLGPFEAPHPMVATGEGRWQFEPRFIAGAETGEHQFWLQAGFPVQAGREANLSSQAPLGFEAAGPQTPSGGGAWLGPRYGAHGVAGWAWIWYRDKDSRHALALEADAWLRGAWNVGGNDLPGTQQQSLVLVPQLMSDFGRFKALAAWTSPVLASQNVPVSTYGTTHLRVLYGF
jgi:hypothetical protein